MSKKAKIILLIGLLPALAAISIAGYATSELKIFDGKIVGWDGLSDPAAKDSTTNKMMIIVVIGMVLALVSLFVYGITVMVNTRGATRAERKNWIKSNLPWYTVFGYIVPVIALIAMLAIMPKDDAKSRDDFWSSTWATILVIIDVAAGISILTSGVYLLKNLGGSIISK